MQVIVQKYTSHLQKNGSYRAKKSTHQPQKASRLPKYAINRPKKMQTINLKKANHKPKRCKSPARNDSHLLKKNTSH